MNNGSYVWRGELLLLVSVWLLLLLQEHIKKETELVTCLDDASGHHVRSPKKVPSECQLHVRLSAVGKTQEVESFIESVRIRDTRKTTYRQNAFICRLNPYMYVLLVYVVVPM